jgi:microcompartment protein CcmK/EutM
MRVSDSSDREEKEEENSPIDPALFRIVREKPKKM